jgi:DNA-binding NtrC family response regulator
MNALYPGRPILVVDDEEEIRASVAAALLPAGITNVAECADGDAARDKVREGLHAAIVLDLTMPGMSGLPLLQFILEETPQTPVIVATGTGDVETAVRCMRLGAFDYLPKPIDRTRLVTSVRHAVEKWETAAAVSSLSDGMLSRGLAHPEAFAGVVTANPAMQAIFKYIEAIAPTSLPVLVTGETGVGKELVARAIHALSGRRGDFVPVNVAGLDDTLFADALFGHNKGAYTGADAARVGLIARAEQGTLFLDEIGDLAPESQIKLLRLLQEREYHPLGSDAARSTTARFVFATNLDVTRTSGAGRFRKDLLYRLRAHHVRVPPLRERPEDLPLLVDHFFERAAQSMGKERPTVPRELLQLLRAHPFPGNVRELEGMVNDAMVRHRSKVLSLQSFREVIAALPETDGNADGDENPFAGRDQLPTLKQAARLLVGEAMRRAGGNQSVAAGLLGVTRSALNRRLNSNH